MKRSRSPILFILLNIILSAAVALGVITYLGGSDGGGGSAQSIPITVQILVTATPDPDGDATRIANAVEATVELLQADIESTREVELPPDILSDLSDGETSTIDSSSGSESTTINGVTLPDGCIVHSLAEGENPAALSQEYGVSVSAILIANNLTEDDARFLQIGDELVIPLPNCPVDQLVPPTPTPAPTTEQTPTPEGAASVTLPTQSDSDVTEPASDVTPTPTPTPTATPALAPTAFNAQVQIVEVLSPGDITAEGIRIVNQGNAVNVAGWTLTDAQGNEFILPEQRLFTNGSVTIYTRPGEDTPIVFYWGRSTAVWGDDGDIATLSDANGNVQSSVRVDTLAP